ncbi:type II toxin-antitoxin system HipA family toxin [Chitinilyticum aquatile]|uniref:type II toxin-antitoxin system HipA family toxin n=1 Tax=Chitinilyticum aquatile TaxID=362520 RepID=UPI00040659B1|nr:type II toxin-antitoxin system HipA family toxin [Chitinilyticum aquatile]
MVARHDAIIVCYQGMDAGAAAYDPNTGLTTFEYTPRFVETGIELSPLQMPLVRGKIYQFPALDPEAFKGLPGLLADSLPDDFGNAVLNAWIARHGRDPRSITPIERLQYTGIRGMGALEFSPAKNMHSLNAVANVAIEELVSISQSILDQRQQFDVELAGDDVGTMMSLLSVGTSAGGARPKAVLAFNSDFTRVKSGQVDAPENFTHCLLKFDGVYEQRSEQQTFGDPRGFGAMEYVYYLMATDCNIKMMPCRLLPEGPRRHFVTQRFDRVGNHKVHVQTLNGLAHVSYKRVGQYSYEELFQVMRRLRLPYEDAEQMLRRMIFNVIARNHDDHPKNFAFLLDPAEQRWRLAPAYDLAFSYKPGSRWVNSHALTINGKRENFERADLLSFSALSPRFTPSLINNIVDETLDVVSQWAVRARVEDVPESLILEVSASLRLQL